uniref:Uncharacterized protein n=1 Tax=Micrurus carvalhoi TaxID=3147026 RepID=A0A2H6NIU5_9SAUR
MKDLHLSSLLVWGGLQIQKNLAVILIRRTGKAQFPDPISRLSHKIAGFFKLKATEHPNYFKIIYQIKWKKYMFSIGFCCYCCNISEQGGKRQYDIIETFPNFHNFASHPSSFLFCRNSLLTSCIMHIIFSGNYYWSVFYI